MRRYYYPHNTVMVTVLSNNNNLQTATNVVYLPPSRASRCCQGTNNLYTPAPSPEPYPIQNLSMGSFVCPQPAMVIPQVVSPGMFYAPMQQQQQQQQPIVGGTPVYQQPQLPPPTSAQNPLYTEEDVQLVKDMFPAIETDVIQSVFIAQRGNKNAVINSLLSMSNDQ